MALHFEDTFTVWNTYQKDYVLDLGKTANGKEYCEVAVTSSSKDKQSGQYTTDFKGKIRFYGNALKKIKGMGLLDKGRIKVKGTMTNIGSNGRISQYQNIVGWEVEKVETTKSQEVPKPVEIMEDLQPLDDLSDTLPF